MIPLVIAHRGASQDAVENTLPAIHLAKDQGADLIEVDVQRTRDGVLVIHHDDDLARSAGDPRRIDEVDLEELARLPLRYGRSDVSDPPCIPTLSDSLATAAPLPMAVEVKSPAEGSRRLADEVLDLLADSDADPRTCVLSFDAAITAGAVRRLGPARAGLIRNLDYGPNSWRDGLVTSAGIVVLSKRVATEEAVRLLRGAGRKVWIYSLDETEEIRRFWRAGAEGIVTNRPGVAREVIGPPA